MTLPSEIRELHERIKQLNIEKELIGTVILHQITRDVRQADFLSEEQKDKLISLFWEGRKEDV